MDYSIKYTCQSNRFSEPFNLSVWSLEEARLTRNNLDIYPLKSISDIRLTYFPGGRGPARYVCSFALQNTWDRKQGILSFTQKKDPEQYNAYYTFVNEMISRISTKRPDLKIHVGLSLSMYMFYVLFLIALAWLPYTLAENNLLEKRHIFKITLLVLFSGIPLIRSILFHYPKILSSEVIIPERYLPKPQ